MLEIQEEVKVIRFIEFDSIRFYNDGKGYWCSSNHKRLHQYIWEYNNGKIPKGYHIHHIDLNKDNNSIENLSLMKAYDHLSLHGKLTDTEDAVKSMNHARQFASEWHGTEKGIEWHKGHYDKYKDKLHKKVKCLCSHCGKEFMSIKRKGNRFCCNNCKASYRRKHHED